MSAQPWYGAKCIFRHTNLTADGGASVYEERIVLFRASSEEEALGMAEREAKVYATDDIEYLGFVELYHLATDRIGDRTELYSQMRTSSLAPRDYLNHFYDTGSEHSRGTKSAI
jgi:hypothetical protein